MQCVEDCKEIHKREINWTPGEKSKTPCEAQKHSESSHTAKVLKATPVLQVMRVLLLDATKLNHHHDEHAEVQQEHNTEICHHCNIEGDVVFQPTAVEKKRAITKDTESSLVKICRLKIPVNRSTNLLAGTSLLHKLDIQHIVYKTGTYQPTPLSYT